ncbi:MAG: acetylxylan esterase [Vicinamibacteria bacterium]
MKRFGKLLTPASGLLAVLALVPVAPAAAQAVPGTAPPAGASGAPPAPGPGSGRSAQLVDPRPRTLSPYFTRSTAAPKPVDKDGFVQRWLLLEPISKPNRTNTVFTGTYVRAAFSQEYFPNQFTVVPKDGDVVKVGEQELRWHALDSSLFNVKLFRFAYGLDKPVYGVLFWAVTVVNSPREQKNVRLAAGSNASSMWWVNGEEAVSLFDDRRMVMDDAVSRRLTLKAGKNVVRGAVINGPGMSDFCVRFVDENGSPLKDLTVSLGGPGK